MRAFSSKDRSRASPLLGEQPRCSWANSRDVRGRTAVKAPARRRGPIASARAMLALGGSSYSGKVAVANFFRRERTARLGALIIGGVVGVVGIKMQPNYDESRLQPITVDAPRSSAPTVPPAPPTSSLAAPTPSRTECAAGRHERRSSARPRSNRSSPPTTGDTIEAATTEAATMTGTTTVAATTAAAMAATAATAATAVPGDTSYVTPQRRLRDRLLPFAARTRIIGWVLLLVFAALGIVTFVAWRLLISATDARMHSELRVEIQQFTELAAPGVIAEAARRSRVSTK